MGGGSKGQSQQNTNTYQTSTYAPNQQTTDALNAALGKAQTTAQTPFNLPQAPVAGFSPDQLNAFNTVNNSQGIGNPYLQQASNYYSPQGAQQFYNPAVNAVTAQLKDTFGAQASQNNANLTQAAGGVGADRIAVGQADLAHQQDLAAGQTYSNLWNSAVGQSQAAGQGALATGNQAFNQAFGGAQQQLGTGGLQQQLQQAQLNAPYQWQVAQSAFPYQQSNFLTNATAALASGYGGTTSGYGTSAGTSTPAQPSPFSQALGLGTAAAGVYGSLSGGTNAGIQYSPDAGLYNPGTSAAADAQNDAFSDAGLARGGVAHFDGGGAASPYGATSTTPINIAGQSIIPDNSQGMPKIAPHIPQIDLSPPKQQQQSSSSSSGPSFGDLAKAGATIATMFANRGGSVSPENMRTFDGHDPHAFFARGGYAEGGAPDDEPYRLAGPAAMDAWRKGADSDAADLPDIIKTGGMKAPKTRALAFTGEPDASAAPAVEAPSAPNPYYTTPTAPAAIPTREKGFSDSPWSALMQAGLGMMAGTSPFAGVNIGQGGLQGMKALQQQKENAQKDETTDMAARRLSQEAAFHADALKEADRPYQQMTKQQQSQADRQEAQDALAQQQFDRPYKELTMQEKAHLEQARLPQGYVRDANGVLSYEPGGPNDPESIRREADAKRLPAMNKEDMLPMVQAYQAGDHSVMANVGRGAQGPQNIQQFWGMLAENLRNEGKDGKEIAAARANFMAESAAAKTAAVRESTVQSAVNEAKLTFPQLIQRSAELPRTNIVPINKLLEYGRTNTGSPEQNKYGAALQAAITAYSQAMSRTGANTVHAQQHAEDILGKAQGHEGIKATVEQLEAEMEIARMAPEQTRKAILDRILGKSEPIATEKPKPSPDDIAYAKKHPEVTGAFHDKFGVYP